MALTRDCILISCDGSHIYAMGAVQEAAELVAKRSCGEGWLLQPKIADMPEMEYRCSFLLPSAICRRPPSYQLYNL